MAERYDGLPFFIGSGTKVSEDKLPDVLLDLSSEY